MIRPKCILRDIGREYPNAWRTIKTMRADKGRGLPDWPDWCYIPIAAGYAVVTNGSEPNAELFGPLSPAVITAAATWRISQGVYRFDADLYNSLVNQPLDGNIPCDALKRLPEWCVYIETYNASWLTIPIDGFWAHLESDANNGRMELRFVFIASDGRNISLPVHLGGWSIGEGIDRMRQEANRMMIKHGIPTVPGDVSLKPVAEQIVPFLQLVLYLCADNVDMPAMPKHPSSRARTSGAIDAPREPRTWNVGERIGAAIRKYRNSEAHESHGGTHASPRPHMRRAHYHHYWTGPRDGERKLVLRWLPPIPIGVDENEDDLPAVIRRVEK